MSRFYQYSVADRCVPYRLHTGIQLTGIWKRHMLEQACHGRCCVKSPGRYSTCNSITDRALDLWNMLCMGLRAITDHKPSPLFQMSRATINPTFKSNTFILTELLSLKDRNGTTVSRTTGVNLLIVFLLKLYQNITISLNTSQ